MWQPVLSWSFNQYSAQYSFQATGCFPTIVETMDSDERGMNPVAITIINTWKEYWPCWGSNQRPPVLKSATLPTELWGVGSYDARKTKQAPPTEPMFSKGSKFLEGIC